MTKRVLLAQFSAYLLMASIASGLGALLPVYVARLGGTTAFIGYYTALGTLAVIVGTIGAGWLADRLRRQRLPFVLACLLLAGALALMGRAASLWQLTLLNCGGGLAIGAGFSLVTMLTGLSAPPAERGRLFGVLALTTGASTMVGGLSSGPIVDRWGFPTLFTIATVTALGCLAIGLCFRDIRPPEDPERLTRSGGRRLVLGRNLPYFLAASLFSSATYVLCRLGLIVTMDHLGFAATAISFTVAVGGFVSMPGALMMGWLSDRVGRKRMVLACYTAGLVCVPALAWSRSLESFWVASVLLAVLSSASAAGSALVTDSLPVHALGTGLSLMAGAANLGGFLAAPLIGLALQQLGQRDAFLVAVIVPLISIAVFLPVRERQAV